MTSHDAFTSGTSRVLTGIFGAFEDWISYPISHRLWNAVCDKVFECTKQAPIEIHHAVLVLWKFQVQIPVLTKRIGVIFVVVVVLGFTTLLISQVISVAFYSEREKSEKFCSKALISGWGSFTFRKSTTLDPRLYFPSEAYRHWPSRFLFWFFVHKCLSLMSYKQFLWHTPRGKKSKGVMSGDLGGHKIGAPHPIHLSGKRLSNMFHEQCYPCEVVHRPVA